MTANGATSARESQTDEEVVYEEPCRDQCENFRYLNRFHEGHVTNLVLVNFYMFGKFAFTRSYPLDINIKQIKYDVANKIQIPEKYLQIIHWHVMVYDCTTLEYVSTKCKGFLNFDITNNSDLEPRLDRMIVPDIITVHLTNENGEPYEITVEIEDRKILKPYVGGFRHKKSGLEYHHAFTQTGPPPEKIPPREKFTRDSQTKLMKNRLTEMMYSRATQMSNEHIWISPGNDVILQPNEVYETAEERERRIGVLEAVRTIQRYYRRWKFNMALKELHEEYQRRLLCAERERQELLKDQSLQRKKEILNKVFPRTRSDFSMLYAMVDRWKKAHIERISRMHTSASKLADFYLLLCKEIEMLNVIERQRMKLKEEMKIRDEVRFFESISDPIRWIGYKGFVVEMDTLETQKGRTFKDLYFSVCNHKISNEERIELISELANNLRKHNCVVGNEIVALIDREIDLLKIGMKPKELDMLYKRIQALLLKHYKMPECNEGVTDHIMKVKEQNMEDNLFLCTRCEYLKTSEEYPLSHRNKKFIACTICTWYDRHAEPWIDIAPYRFILRCIRRDERKRGSTSTLLYIIQEKDIYYIVERIWHAQSIVNENKQLEKLRLVRWNVKEEWSPWNCILLTEKEAESHVKVKNLEDVYDEEFRKIIISKHMFARCVFANVLMLERSIKAAQDEELANRRIPEPDEIEYVTYVEPCETQINSEVLEEEGLLNKPKGVFFV